MKLATATPADAPRLTRFVNAAYRGDTARQGWTTEADLLDGQRIDEEGMQELLARPDAAMLLCQHEAGELLGSFHAQANGPLLYLSMLAVNPAGQAQGVGKFLLHAAENYGRQHGCTTSRMCYFRPLRTNRLLRAARLPPHRGHRSLPHGPALRHSEAAAGAAGARKGAVGAGGSVPVVQRRLAVAEQGLVDVATHFLLELGLGFGQQVGIGE